MFEFSKELVFKKRLIGWLLALRKETSSWWCSYISQEQSRRQFLVHPGLKPSMVAKAVLYLGLINIKTNRIKSNQIKFRKHRAAGGRRYLEERTTMPHAVLPSSSWYWWVEP